MDCVPLAGQEEHVVAFHQDELGGDLTRVRWVVAGQSLTPRFP
jgi:hypothetical protein